VTSTVDSPKTPSSPGTWDVETGEAVEWSDALRGWSEAALVVLLRTAQTYNKIVTYKELSESIQTSTGVRTHTLLNTWIGKVLEAVAAQCHLRGEVLLTALCVRQDGTVGNNYAKAARPFTNGIAPVDPELHAADERLRCYQKYAVDLPANGGRSQLTRQVAAKRKAAAPEITPPLCPIHFTVLPQSGQCDDCA
jgi:hypothetical protein